MRERAAWGVVSWRQENSRKMVLVAQSYLAGVLADICSVGMQLPKHHKVLRKMSSRWNTNGNVKAFPHIQQHKHMPYHIPLSRANLHAWINMNLHQQYSWHKSELTHRACSQIPPDN